MSNKNLHPDLDPDLDPHWFSYVSLPHFKHRSCSLRSRYILLLFGIGWSIAWLEAEMLVGICLLLNKDWALRVIQTRFTDSSTSSIASSLPPTVLQVIESVGGVAGWVVLGSTGLSMCVVMWNWIQARAIVESDSIPRAFLDATAYRLWSIKSYAHFCLLAKISWGRGFRQWIVMAVYFGLQGFMSALVTLPRLIVYGFILYSVRGIPDLALSSATFETLGIDGFSALRSGLLKGSLLVITLSAILHTLYTVKVLIAAAMCSCTICCLGRLKKAMDRDLKTRITDLVVSTCGHNDNKRFSGLHGEVKGDIANLSHSGLGSFGENQNTSAALPLEKDSSLHQQPSEGLDTHLYSLQDSFDGIVLGSDKRRASSHHNNGEPTITVHVSPPTDAMPTDAIPARDQGSLQDSSVRHSPDRHQTTLTSTQPTVLGASLNADGAQSTRNYTSELDTRRPSCQSDTNHLMPGGPEGRLTSLSFYDDLLKSISSERMMYAASIYNQATPDLQQPQYEGDICGRESNNTPNEVMSIARCSSIPLTLPSCSEYEYRSHAERPVHPFDVSQDHPTTTILFEQHSRPTMAELCVHPLDTSVAGFGNFPQPQSQERQSMSVYNNPLGLGQRGGPNSQEAIENWRVLVEPRSPAFAELDQHGSMDDAHDEFSDSISRRGTIPIVLSGHLQEAAIYEEDQLFTLEDLDAPRPFYAYGQTRTQRQGSVNSSTAGYNPSIASSPSLADSLSNPMYHQQSHGITNFNSTGSRPFLPRKCSLPGSVNSSTKDDAGSSAPYLQNQIHQASSAPSYLAYPSSAIRTKAKTPSHLSNMIMHCDDTNSVDATEQQQSTSVQKKGHRRSQSQGVRSSQTSAPSWDPFAKLAQTGCALTNIPHRGVDLNSLPQARTVLDTAFQLSPPLLRRHSSHQRENLAPSSSADYTGGYDQRAGWNEYVGLGLTFDSSTYTNQQHPFNRDMDDPYRSPLDNYFDQTQANSARSSFYQHWNHSEMRARPNVPERLTSGITTITTTTELSNAKTFTTPFQAPFTNKCVVTSYAYDNEHERNIALGRSPQRKETALRPMPILSHQQTLTTTRTAYHHDNLSMHRRPSQRNKKNLVVNIVPLSC